MKIFIKCSHYLIPDADTEISADIPVGKLVRLSHSQVKKAVIDAGYDWIETDVFVANWPEKGRYLLKQRGRINLSAGG